MRTLTWFKLPVSWRNDLAIRMLSPAQRGILVDLWCHAAEFAELPNDLWPLVKLAGGQRRERDVPALERFFPVVEGSDGPRYCPEIDEQREHMESVSRARAEAGSVGGRVKAEARQQPSEPDPGADTVQAKRAMMSAGFREMASGS